MEPAEKKRKPSVFKRKNILAYLEEGNDPNISFKGFSLLEVAAKHLSVGTVKMVLRAGANLRAALTQCLYRKDVSEVHELLEILFAYGADPAEEENAIRVASKRQDAGVVKTLLRKGAIATQAALMAACRNRIHGAEIIPILINDGAVPDAQVLNCANRWGNGNIMRALKPHYSYPQSYNTRTAYNSPDLLAMWSERTALEEEDERWSRRPKHKTDEAMYTWAWIRKGNTLVEMRDMLIAMEKCKSADTWRVVVSEWLTIRHHITRDTLLHIASKSGNVEAVKICCTYKLNPLLRNVEGKLAVELTKEKTIIDILTHYSQWRPSRTVTYWYGPYFRREAVTFLLICKRAIQSLPKEMRLYIIKKLSEITETSMRLLELKK